MNSSTPAPLRKAHNPVHTHKNSSQHTHAKSSHTHSFHWSRAEKCSEGEQAGIMDLIQEAREKEREREGLEGGGKGGR